MFKYCETKFGEWICEKRKRFFKDISQNMTFLLVFGCKWGGGVDSSCGI